MAWGDLDTAHETFWEKKMYHCEDWSALKRNESNYAAIIAGFFSIQAAPIFKDFLGLILWLFLGMKKDLKVSKYAFLIELQSVEERIHMVFCWDVAIWEFFGEYMNLPQHTGLHLNLAR